MDALEFEPVCQPEGTLEENKPGWYIAVLGDDDHYVRYKSDDLPPLCFATKSDCQLACDALNDHQQPYEFWRNISDDGFRDVVLSRLMW